MLPGFKPVEVGSADAKWVSRNLDSGALVSEEYLKERFALQFAPCERWPASAAKKIQPQYPKAARDAHQQGRVTVYAMVGAEGRVERTQVLESAGQDLDRATLNAVQQWIYPAVSCGTQPLPTEIEIRVNYSLSPR